MKLSKLQRPNPNMVASDGYGVSPLFYDASFPPRVLYAVPENESVHGEDTCGALDSQHTPLGSRNTGEGRWTSLKRLIRLSHRPKTPSSGSWMVDDLEKPIGRRPSGQWVNIARGVLHFINLAAGVTVITLLAHALVLHHQLRHIRQFNGADSAWPKQMSLTPTILLLSIASAGVVKACIFLVLEIFPRFSRRGNFFLIFSTACAVELAAGWMSAIVVAELKKGKENDFTTWACARADASSNQVIPYGSICTEEVCISCHELVMQTC
jgi:hypothetical protein